MKKLVFVLASALPGLSALATPVATTTDIPVYSYEVVHVYPHDRGAFTEGLFFRDGFLYESTGMNGASSVRKVELKSGRVVQQHDLPQAFFGEGIVDWKNKLIAVTWRTQHGFVLDIDDLSKVEREFSYPGEGWGMTRNDKNLLLSDGTSTIRLLDPQTLTQTGAIEVTAQGRPLTQINELEWIKGEIYANLWQTQRIARIDPKTGDVVGWIDCKGLLPAKDFIPDHTDVLNGIAYDPGTKRLWLTGKFWPKVFEVRLVKR